MIIIQKWTDDGLNKVGERELSDEEWKSITDAIATQVDAAASREERLFWARILSKLAI